MSNHESEIFEEFFEDESEKKIIEILSTKGSSQEDLLEKILIFLKEGSSID